MSAIKYQVSIIGRGVSHLSKAAATALVERTIDGHEPPRGLDVRIHVWREGRELNWRDDNPRATVLRETLRRLLQSGRLSLPVRRRARSRPAERRLSRSGSRT